MRVCALTRVLYMERVRASTYIENPPRALIYKTPPGKSNTTHKSPNA